MMNVFFGLNLIVILAVVAPALSDSPPQVPRSPASDGRPSDNLRAMSEQVASKPLSPALDVLIKDETLGLTREQKRLIGRIDEMGRHVVASWLVRGLDGPEPADPEELAARIGEPFEQIRSGVVGHSEALVRTAVLTPEQERLWRIASRPPAPTKGIERYGSGALATRVEDWEMADLRSALAIYTDAARRQNCSPLFLRILGPGPLKWTGARSEQIILLNQVDETARDVIASWLERGLDDPEPPTSKELVGRLTNRNRIRAAIAANVEAIMLHAVLESDQRTSFLRYHWAIIGNEALKDPELAGFLGLNRFQRAEINRRLGLKQEFTSNLSTARLQAYPLLDDLADFVRGQAALTERLKIELKNYDYNILNMLTPKQARKLARLLDGAIPEQKKTE